MHKIIILILIGIILSVERTTARTLTHQQKWSSSKTIEIDSSNLSETELIENAQYVGMDSNAIRELLRTRTPVRLTEIDANGQIFTTTYKLTPDGKISSQTISEDNNGFTMNNSFESASSPEIDTYIDSFSGTNSFDDFINKYNPWTIDNWHKHIIGLPENSQPNVFKQHIPKTKTTTMTTTTTTTPRTFRRQHEEKPIFDEWEEERRNANNSNNENVNTKLHTTIRTTPRSRPRSTPRPILRHSAPHPTLLSKLPKPFITTTPLPPLDVFLETINKSKGTGSTDFSKNSPKTYIINIDDLPTTTPRPVITPRSVQESSIIDAVLAKLDLTAADIMAQNGELVANFIEKNGRILSIRLVLSSVNGAADKEAPIEMPIK